MKVKKIIAVFLLAIFSSKIFSEEIKAEPYRSDEFPQFMKDLRRAEIITLGSLPFVTITATLVYSTIRWGMNDFKSGAFPNPFVKASKGGFTQKEQIGILCTSIGISFAIGITDLIVMVVKRKNAEKRKLQSEKENAPIIVVPIQEDETATRIPIPERVIAKYHLPKMQNEKILQDAFIAFAQNENNFSLFFPMEISK